MNRNWMRQGLSVLLGCALLLLCCGCGASEPKLEDCELIQLSGDTFAQGIGGKLYCALGETGYRLEIHARNGRFSLEDSMVITGRYPDYTTAYSSDVLVEESGYVYWEDFSLSSPAEVSSCWYGTQTFLEFLITEGDSYVGYAVVRISLPEGQNGYTVSLAACKVLADDADRDGVTKETFQKLIEETEGEYLTEG